MTDEKLKDRELSAEFLGQTCRIEFGLYDNLRVAIQLVCENGEPMATATVNLPNMPLGLNDVFIKDYSENTGMAAALVAGGVISPEPIRCIKSGYAVIPVHALTYEALRLVALQGLREAV